MVPAMFIYYIIYFIIYIISFLFHVIFVCYRSINIYNLIVLKKDKNVDQINHCVLLHNAVTGFINGMGSSKYFQSPHS